MLEQIIFRANTSKLAEQIVVATTEGEIDEPVRNICNSERIKCFSGSENNVLQRIIGAAEQTQADVVVRLTADNPFVDGKLVDMVVQSLLSDYSSLDYAANVDNCGFPYGLFAEAVKYKTLRTLAASANDEEKEHVTLKIRRNPETFSVKKILADRNYPDIKLTVDTAADRARLIKVFEKLQKKNPEFSLDEISNMRVS